MKTSIKLLNKNCPSPCLALVSLVQGHRKFDFSSWCGASYVLNVDEGHVWLVQVAQHNQPSWEVPEDPSRSFCCRFPLMQ